MSVQRATATRGRLRSVLGNNFLLLLSGVGIISFLLNIMLFQIMSSRRACPRNDNACKVETIPLVLDHAVSNVEFHNTIQILAKV